MAQVTTASSAGVSDAIILNPVLKSTTVALTVNSGSSGITTIQATLDDPTTTPAPTMQWFSLSSAIVSSGIDGVGQMYTVLSPLGGVRLATAISSVGGAYTTTATLKALQSVSA